MAPHTWSLEERHALHILATHYPNSVGADRTAIFNQVFSLDMSWEKIRDEYGGHKAGSRNRPGGLKPTRSIMWNDHVCRDEFGLPGPFDQQQAADRLAILQRLQAAINSLGLSGRPGLGAISILPGMQRADTGAVPSSSNTAAQAPAAYLTATASGPAGGGNNIDDEDAEQDEQENTGEGGEGETAEEEQAEGDENKADAEHGGRDFYHVREVVKVGDDWVHQPIPGLAYRATVPTSTWFRKVNFADSVVKQVRICDIRRCGVCGSRS